MDTIPIYDGPLTGASIKPDRGNLTDATALTRTRRAMNRRACDHVMVCFCVELDDEKVDHVECPALNLSKGGVAIEFDQALKPGTKGSICYRSMAHQAVRVNCVVRRCEPHGEHRFLVGIEFDRKLLPEELKPALHRAGREVFPGLRARKLRS